MTLSLEALGDALDKRTRRPRSLQACDPLLPSRLRAPWDCQTDQIAVIWRRGAFLHDIGKMAIPDAMLREAGKLTPTKS